MRRKRAFGKRTLIALPVTFLMLVIVLAVPVNAITAMFIPVSKGCDQLGHGRDDMTSSIPEDVHEKVISTEDNTAPFDVRITVFYEGENGPAKLDLSDGEETTVSIDEMMEVYLQGQASDDYTIISALVFDWTVTLPSGSMINRRGYQVHLELIQTGVHTISLIVMDDEGYSSEVTSVQLIVEEEEYDEPKSACMVLLLIPVGLIAFSLFIHKTVIRVRRMH